MSDHRAPVPSWDPRAYLKSIVAFLAPGIALIVVPLTAGDAPSSDDWWKAIGACLSAAIAVYVVRNRETEPQP